MYSLTNSQILRDEFSKFVKILNNKTSKNNQIKKFQELYGKGSFIYKALDECWDNVPKGSNLLLPVKNLIKILTTIFPQRITSNNLKTLEYLLSPSEFPPEKTLGNFGYHPKAFILYKTQRDPEKFMKDVISLNIIGEKDIMDKFHNLEINSTNRTKILKNIKKVVAQNTIEDFIKKEKNVNSELYKTFFNNILTVGSSYSPIGVKENNNLKIGRVYDGLEVQWKTQGHNNKNNKYGEVRQRSKTGAKWTSNKKKIEFILKHWNVAKDLIMNSDNKVLVPLREFLSNSSGNMNSELTDLKHLLDNLCENKTYLSRAFVLFSYLNNRNININGENRNGTKKYKFITLNDEEGTFLTPIYFLFWDIKNSIRKTTKKTIGKKTTRKTTKKTIRKNTTKKNTEQTKLKEYNLSNLIVKKKTQKKQTKK